MHYRTLAKTVVLPIALAISTASLADDDTGFYVSVSANRLSADFEDENDVKFGESDSTAGVRAGYMFNDMFGIEAGYLDLGKYDAAGDRPGNEINLNADAWVLAGVVNWSVVDKVDLYGKLGVYHIDAESDSVIAGVTLNANDDETEAFGAIGAEYDMGNVNVFFEISKADTDVSELTIDVASLGVKYEF